jgi:hypothetical protein
MIRSRESGWSARRCAVYHVASANHRFTQCLGGFGPKLVPSSDGSLSSSWAKAARHWPTAATPAARPCIGHLTPPPDVVTMTIWHAMSSARANSRPVLGHTCSRFEKDELWSSRTAVSPLLSCDHYPRTRRCLRRLSSCPRRAPLRCRPVTICRRSDQSVAPAHRSPARSARIGRIGSDSLL